MRIDSHHHVWDRAVTPQPWIDVTQSAIDRDFSIDDLVAAAGDRISRTVVVQTACEVRETELLLELAEATPVIAAVVGWADLTASDLGETLARLLDSPNGAWLRGIRHQVQAEPDDRWLERPDVVQGLGVVGELGLVYELLTLPPQLAAATVAVSQLPHVQFVLDHLSKPPLRGSKQDLRSWEADLRKLAAHPNVSAKISGLVTEADWHQWTIEDIRPVVDVAIDAFGPERLMIGSDWPVCLLAASYERVYELHHELLSGLSAGDRHGILGGNAAAIYDI